MDAEVIKEGIEPVCAGAEYADHLLWLESRNEEPDGIAKEEDDGDSKTSD